MRLLVAEIRPCERAQVMPFLALPQVCFTAVFIDSCQKHIHCKVGGYHSGVYERFQSSGLWHHVNWYAVITVLEELAAPIFKVIVVKRECTKSNKGCSNLVHSAGNHSSTNSVSYSRRLESSHIHWLNKYNSKYLDSKFTTTEKEHTWILSHESRRTTKILPW